MPIPGQQGLGDPPREGDPFGREQAGEDGLAHQRVPPPQPAGVLAEQMSVRGGPGRGEHDVLRLPGHGRQQLPVRVGS